MYNKVVIIIVVLVVMYFVKLEGIGEKVSSDTNTGVLINMESCKDRISECYPESDEKL